MQLCYSKFLIIALLCVNAFLVISGTNITQLDIELGDKIEKTTCFSSKEATTTSLGRDVYLIEKSNTIQAQKVSEPSLEKSFFLQDFQLPANQNSHLSITQYTQIVSWIYHASHLPNLSFNTPLSITQYEVIHTTATTTERKNSFTHEIKEIKSSTILKKASTRKSANQSTTLSNQDDSNNTEKGNDYLLHTEKANTNDTQKDNNYLYVHTENTANTNNTKKESNYLYTTTENTNTNDTKKESNYLYTTTENTNTNNTKKESNYLYTTTENTNTNNTKKNNNYLYTATKNTNTNNAKKDNYTENAATENINTNNAKKESNYLYTKTKNTNTNNAKKDNYTENTNTNDTKKESNYLYTTTENTNTNNTKKDNYTENTNTNDTKKDNSYLYIDAENTNTNNTQKNNTYLYIDTEKTANTNGIQKDNSYLYIDTENTINDTQDDLYITIKKLTTTHHKNGFLYVDTKSENVNNTQDKNDDLSMNVPDNQDDSKIDTENNYLSVDKKNVTNSHNIDAENANAIQQGRNYLYVETKNEKNTQDNSNLYTENPTDTQDDSSLDTEKEKNTQDKNDHLYVDTTNTQNQNNYLYVDTTNTQNQNNYLYVETENTINTQDNSNYLYIATEKTNTDNTQNENGLTIENAQAQDKNDFLDVAIKKENTNNIQNENYVSMEEENTDSSLLKTLALKRETIIIKVTSNHNDFIALNVPIPLSINNEIEINNNKNQEFSNHINKTASHKGQKKIDKKHTIVTQKQFAASERNQYSCNTEIIKDALTTNNGTGQSITKTSLSKTVNGHIVNSIPTISHVENNKGIQLISQNNFEQNTSKNIIGAIALKGSIAQIYAPKIAFSKASNLNDLYCNQVEIHLEVTSTISGSFVAENSAKNLHLCHIRNKLLECNASQNSNIDTSLDKNINTLFLHLSHIRKTQFSSFEKNIAIFEKHNDSLYQKSDLSKLNMS